MINRFYLIELDLNVLVLVLLCLLLVVNAHNHEDLLLDLWRPVVNQLTDRYQRRFGHVRAS